MIQIKFEPHEKSKDIRGLWQYDYGRTLQISGLDLPEQVKVEFSMNDKIGETAPRTGITTDGITEVAIPNTLLKNQGCSTNYNIYVFIYIEDEEKGFTYRKIILRVQSRPKPGNYSVPDEEPDYVITQTKQNAEDIKQIQETMVSEENLAESVNAALTEAKESGEFNGADGKDGEPGSKGEDGASAYEIAVANGFEGTEEEWLASLVGPEGPQGPEGKEGQPGATGPAGADGEKGQDGYTPVKGVDYWTEADKEEINKYIATIFVPVTQDEYDALVAADEDDENKYYMIVGDDE